MRRSEVQSLGQLAGEALAAGGGLIEQMHTGIAERAFAHAPASSPARSIHDGISKAVYASVRGGLRGAAVAGSHVASRRTPSGGPELASLPGAAMALAALNGLYGDRVARRIPGLALGMEVRRHGSAVALEPEAIAEVFSDATARMVVFVHGLCETDDAWRFVSRGAQHTDRRSYGTRLSEELGYTPVYLRYNTGLHISDNGRSLARVLERLYQSLPVPPHEIVLVGHSMGGLVARSACHYGAVDELPFTAAVRHVFCLGTPHLGADLEKGANALAWALGRLPETRALGAFLNARSAGIKDLRYGSCVEADWCDCHPDEFLRDRCQEVPFLPHAHYYFVAAALRPGPVGRLLGDLLVRMPSASGRGRGRGRRIPFELENGHELEGLHHFDLLCHPAVYEQLRLWLTRDQASRPALLAASTSRPAR